MLSTPLICCSMGVATACSSVWASAPTYVARTCISGGAMLGNCATGRLKIVMVPTITITIEITIATIGRLIKNFDIGLPSLASPGKRLGVHQHARTNLLHAFGNHAVASLQPLGDNPIDADTLANLYRAHAHFVVAVHRRDLIAALQLGDSALRNKQCVLLDSDGRPNFAVPAGTQNISRIGELSGDPNCAGALIDLAVGKIDCPFVPIGGAVGQNKFETHALVRSLARGVCGEPPIPIEILTLADREINFDGIDGGHRSHRPAARIDQRADLKLRLSSNAVDRSESTRLNSSHMSISYAVFC